MIISQNGLSKPYLLATLAVIGCVLYWGLTKLKAILLSMTIVFSRLLGLDLYGQLTAGLLFEALILIGLAVVLIKVIRLKVKGQKGPAIEFKLSRSKLNKLGIIILLIMAANILFNILSAGTIEKEIVDQIEVNSAGMGYKLARLQLVSYIIKTLDYAIVFILYFLLVAKASFNDKSDIE